MLDSGAVDRLKNDLVEIVAARVPLRKSGSSWKGMCPFHDDRKPSLQVNSAKRQWRCFVCNVGGDSIDFIKRFHKTDFKGALQHLGIDTGKPVALRDIKIIKRLKSIGIRKQKKLDQISGREGNLQYLSRRLNRLINSTDPLERHASLYTFELWLDQEFVDIDQARKKVRETAKELTVRAMANG